MQTLTWNDLPFSRLMLGTVQWGMPYGIANRTGQPSYADVVRIVATAVDGGVRCFDTAASYGTSEEVLGQVLQELRIADQVTVVTKVSPLTVNQLADPASAVRAIETLVENSRRKLQLDCLPIVLFHRETDAVHMPRLEELKQRGWLKHCGVSCDNRPGPAEQLVTSGRVAAIQVPGNVVDRRHEESGIFSAAAARGVAVFLRSVYLQGLLLLEDAEIPESLQGIVPLRHRLTQLAAEAGITLRELAVRYMVHQDGITCVIAGVETVEQALDNLLLFSQGPLPADLLAAIRATACDLPESLITPGQWTK